MAIVYPNVGEAAIGSAGFGITEPKTPWVLRLFSNERVPTALDTAADYDEVEGGGYEGIEIDPADFTVTPGSPTTYELPTQEFSFGSATNIPGEVWGWYLTDSDGTLLCVSPIEVVFEPLSGSVFDVDMILTVASATTD